jgi:beta-glucuronidase
MFLFPAEPEICLQVRTSADSAVPEDVYRLPVGIRKLGWSNTSVTINGKPIYIRGFGRHEDSAVREC